MKVTSKIVSVEVCRTVVVTTVVEEPDPRVYVRVALLTTVDVLYPVPAAAVDELGEPVLRGTVDVAAVLVPKPAALLLERPVATAVEDAGAVPLGDAEARDSVAVTGQIVV